MENEGNQPELEQELKLEQEQELGQEQERDSALLFGLHIVNITVFVILIILVGGLGLFLAKPTVSEYEKRELAKFPSLTIDSLLSGNFTQKIDLFFADTFPGRESLVAVASKLSEMRGVRPDDVRIHESTQQPSARPIEPPAKSGDTALPDPEEQPSANTPTSPAVSQPVKDLPTSELPKQPAPGNGLTPDSGKEATGEKMGSVFLYKNMALPIFWSNKPGAEWYAETLNKYVDRLGDGVQIYNLVIPSAIAFYLPEKYADVSSPQKENIDYIYSLLSPKIKPVDAYTQLAKVTDQYLYFRSDHHWTVRGAYAAYLAFCQTAGFTPVPLEAMEKHQIDNFVGTLYGETQDSKLKETPDFVEYFVPPIKTITTRYLSHKPYDPVESSMFASYATGGQYTYSVFLHGDFPLTDIKTTLTTGRKALVVKESFGNAFAPFLVSHFDEVYVVDQRYFQLGLADFIKDNGVTDLIFANNIFAANTETRVREIERIMDQKPPYPKPAEAAPAQPVPAPAPAPPKPPAPKPAPKPAPPVETPVAPPPAPKPEPEPTPKETPTEDEKPKKILSKRNQELADEEKKD